MDRKIVTKTKRSVKIERQTTIIRIQTNKQTNNNLISVITLHIDNRTQLDKIKMEIDIFRRSSNRNVQHKTLKYRE